MGTGTSGPNVENCSGREGNKPSRKRMQRKGELSEEVLIEYNKYDYMEIVQWVTHETQA